MYIGVQPTGNPSLSRRGRLDRQGGGQTARGGTLGETLSAYMCHHEGPLMGRAKPHAEGGPRPMNL
jgi:hypothetical protein